MTVDQITPRSRRALLAGALGGLVASVASFVQAPSARAGVDGDLVLEASNNASATTTLSAPTVDKALSVIGGATGVRVVGDLAVDANGGSIAVNAIATTGAALGVVGWSQASTTGILGWSTSGNQSTPTVPPKTGVHGVAEQDAAARGVFGRTTSGQGVRGEATTGIGVAAVSDSGPAIDARSNSSAGVIGVGPAGIIPNPLIFLSGVYGAAAAHPGVYGHGSTSQGLRGDSDVNDGVFGNADALNVGPHTHVNNGAGVHGHGGQAGVLGTHDSGFGVQATSQSAPALFASNTSATAAAIVAEGGTGTAIHGHANDGGVNQVNIPASPALTGLYGSAFLAGVAVAAQSESGLAVKAISSLGHAVRGRGQLDGVIGESATGRSGIVGYSGSGSAPAGPAKTGVYGEATQDAAARGVSGFSLAGQGVHGDATTGSGVAGVAITGDGVLGQVTTGRGVHGVATGGQGVAGEATTGIGVRAAATTGTALNVSGKAVFNRAGKVSLLANHTSVDVTVPGGLAGTPLVFALLQYGRTGVWVIAARPNWPSAGLIRIYVNKIASTTASTAVAWFVLG